MGNEGGGSRIPSRRLASGWAVLVVLLLPILGGIAAILLDGGAPARAYLRTSRVISSTRYVFEEFTNTGGNSWTVPKGVSSVDVLLVGGGGGGGSRHAGGGGGGGVVQFNSSVTEGHVYNIWVGAGGAGAGGAAVNDLQGDAGGQSYFLSASTGSGWSATGGQGGKNSDRMGGESGAGSGNVIGHSVYAGGSGLGDGNCGGTNYDWCGGGGAGAGGAGGNASTNNNGGRGGVGRSTTIRGSTETFAGGGGGSSGESGNGYPTSGGVGSDGGGNGGSANGGGGTACTAGTAGGNATVAGAGGGAGGYCNSASGGTNAFSAPGGNGAAGLVIVRYVMPGVTTPSLAASSDSNINNDGITRNTSLTFTGSAPVGSSIQLSTGPSSSGPWTNTGSACSANTNSGEWSCTTGTLSPGTYSVRAVSTTSYALNLTQESSTTQSVTIDTTAPSVLSVTRSGSGTVAAGSSVAVGFTLSESSSSFGVGDVSVSGGSLSGFTGSGVSYSATFTPTAGAEGTASISVPAGGFTDVAGNSNTASSTLSIAYDTLAPSVLSVSRSGSGTVAAGSSVAVGFTLSESSSSFGVGDVSVSGGSLSGFTGSGVSYSATFTPTAGAEGTASISVPAGGFTDVAGNSNTASSTLSIAYDTLRPSVQSFSSSDSSPSNATTFTYTITFSESVTGVIAGDFSNAGSASGCSFLPGTDSGASRTVTVSGCGEGTLTPRFAASAAIDAAGNTGPSLSSDSTTTITRDPAAPTVTLAAATINSSGSASVSSSETGTAYLVRTSVTVSSLASITSAADDVWNQVSIASASSATSLAVTGLIDGTYVAYSVDVAGNLSLVSGTSVTVDSVAPRVIDVTSTLTYGSWVIDLGVGATVSVQVVFDEPVTVDGTPQITLETGDPDRVVDLTSGFGTTTLSGTYTVQAGDTTEDLDYVSSSSLALNGATIRDAAGNDAVRTLAVPGTQYSLGFNKNIRIDTTGPSAPTSVDLAAADDTGTSDSDDYTNKTTLSFTIYTGEAGGTVDVTAVEGATVLRCSTSGPISAPSTCSISNFTDGTWTVTATQTDWAGNVSVASAGLTVVVDTQVATPSAPDLNASSDTGSSNSDRVTGDPTPTFSTTLGETGGSVTFSSGALTCTQTTVTSTTVSCNYGSAISEGAYSFTAVHTDKAGNVSAQSNNTTVIIDSSGPSAPSAPVLDSASDTGSSDSDGITNDSSPTFTTTVSETGGSVTFTSSGGSTCTQSSVTTLTPSCTFSSLGSESVTVTHTDAAGNTSLASAPTSITLDVIPPTIVMSATSPTNSPQFSVVGNEALAGVSAEDFTTSAGCTVGLATVSASSYIVSLSACAEGLVMLTLASGSVTDVAGNATPVSHVAVVLVDYTAPSVSSFTSVASIVNTRSFDFSMTVSESIRGLDGSDFSNVGTAGVCTFTPVTTSATDVTVSVSCPQDGTVIARLAGNSVTDAAGNTGPTSPSDSTTVTIATGPKVLVVTLQPSGAPSGAPFLNQPAVVLRNDVGQTVTGTAAIVTATVTQVSGTGVLVGAQTASVDTSTGVATFSNLGLTGTDGTSYTITFTSTVNGTVLTPATASATVTVGAPAQLAVTTQPVGQGAGASLAIQPVVEIRDSGGNFVYSASASIEVTASGGSLGGTTTVSAQAGTAVFTDLTFAGTAGANYTLTFSSAGLSAATSSNFTVTVGAAIKLVLTTTAANAQYAQAFATQPVVEVQDAGSNRVASSHTVTATLSSGVVVGTTSTSLDATGAGGEVRFAGLGITALPGLYTITYSSPSLASTTQSITLARADQTVSFTDLPDAVYSPTPVALSATSTSNLTVVFSSLSPSICTVNGSAVTMESSGLCRIGADQAGNDYFEPAPQAVQEFTISKATPIFSWADVNKTYGDASFTITPPTASVPGTFTYSSSDITTATVSASTLNIVAGGTSTVSATFTPTDIGKYESGGQITMLLTVNRTTQQPIVLTSVTGVYGDPLVLTVSGGDTNGALSFAVSNGTATGCGEVNGELFSSSRGTCMVTATKAADRNYLSVTTQPTTVTLSARPITVTAEPKDRHYGSADPLLSYQITSGELVIGDALSGALVREAGDNVGRYAIRQGTLDNENYDIDFVSADFEITRRPVTATVVRVSKFYGDPDPVFAHTITSGNLVPGENLAGVLSRTSGETVGLYAIGQGTLTNANNPNYAITFVGDDLTIERRPITVSAVAASKKYSTADPTLEYTVSVGGLVDGEQLVGSLDREVGEDVGDYLITQGTLSNDNNTNYDIAFFGDFFSIYPRPITVTADPKEINYGDDDPVFTYVVGGDGLKAGDSLSGSLARVAGSNVGQHVIVRGTLDNPNYQIAFTGAYLTITRKPITVTADDITINHGDAEPVLTVSTTSGSLVGNDVLAGTPTRDPGTDAGDYVIRQGGVTNANNPNYDVHFVEGTLTIERVTQAPLVIQSVQQTYRVDLSLQQSGGSGDGAVTWEVTDAGTSNCSITGSLLSSSGVVGSSCVVQVSKAANLNFLAATSSATVTVVPRTLSITADSPSKFFGDADPAFTYTITDGLLAAGETLTGALTRAPGDTPGTYAISQGTLINSNYQIIFTPGSLRIDRRPITVTAANDGKVAGQPEPVSLGFTVTAGNVVSGSALSGTPTRVAGELIGTYAITRGGLTNTNNPNYDIAFVPGTFTITGVSQSALVLTAGSPSVLLADSTNLSVSGGSGTGALTYTIVTEEPIGACSLISDVSTSATTVVGANPGACTIMATKASDGTYDGVQSNVVTITVNKRPQVISFSVTSPMTYQAAPFLVSPSSDSGQTVQLSTTTSSVCSVSGFQVQLLFRGLCQLVASIGESTNFLVAQPVAVDVSVSAVLPSAPTVSALTATDDWIAVTFTAGDHGGEVITGYEYSIDAGTTWVAFPTGSITSPLLISDVSPSTTYGVRLRALTSVGASPDSNEMSVVTPAPPMVSSGGLSSTSTVVTTTSTTVVTTTTTVVTSSTAPSTSPSPSTTQATRTSITTSTVRVTTTLADNSVTTERVTTTSVRDESDDAESSSTSTTEPSSPRESIAVATGGSVASRGGELVEMKWVPLETGGATTSWGSVKLTIVAGGSSESGDPLLSDGTMVIERGSQVHIEGSGLSPNSLMEAWIFSDPMLLGTPRVDGQGNLTASFEVPRALPVGGHTLQLMVVENDDTVTDVAIGVIVLDPTAAMLHRSGELDSSTVRVMAAPTVVEVVDVQSRNTALVVLWIVLVLVLVIAAGRLPLVRPRRRLPDVVAFVADDAVWTTRLGVSRWIPPIIGFVLGAWASASTHALPVPPATLLMLLLLVVGVIDPLAGVTGAASFFVAVVVSGGVSTPETLASLLTVSAIWWAPTLLGSAVSRTTSGRLLVISATIRSAVATSMFVAMVELLPSFTSIRTTTNLYVTELAWLVAIASLVRSWIDDVADEPVNAERRSARIGPVEAIVALALLLFVVVNSGGLTVWNVAGLGVLVVVARRSRRREGDGDSGRRGWLAVGAVLLLAIGALDGSLSVSEPVQADDGILVSNTAVDIDG